MNTRLHFLKVKCRIKPISNWVKKDSSKKNISPWWNGKYKCINDACANIYHFKIVQNPNLNKEQIILDIKFKPADTHVDYVPIKIQSRGNNRKQQGLELIAYGTSNAQMENVNDNFSKPILGI